MIYDSASIDLDTLSPMVRRRLLEEADGVAARGGKSFTDTFQRVLPLEIDKK